ncbi:hypothetical protein E0H51_26605 [Rhizobium leguminosarum bv. viciae]|uniref:hypothetical protein n=1 Tax=Rhizobium leguminosarum TaxID=384 RepID=UPI00103A282A|nr:hypothetical protein [Rhizobium leguminosarum]TBY71940.1 hypothetical protein E0H51_26605 [Rhizobium leguminosarum bv. viciae]
MLAAQTLVRLSPAHSARAEHSKTSAAPSARRGAGYSAIKIAAQITARLISILPWFGVRLPQQCRFLAAHADAIADKTEEYRHHENCEPPACEGCAEDSYTQAGHTVGIQAAVVVGRQAESRVNAILNRIGLHDAKRTTEIRLHRRIAGKRVHQRLADIAKAGDVAELVSPIVEGRNAILDGSRYRVDLGNQIIDVECIDRSGNAVDYSAEPSSDQRRSRG